jgi:hypothetical protein
VLGNPVKLATPGRHTAGLELLNENSGKMQEAFAVLPVPALAARSDPTIGTAFGRKYAENDATSGSYQGKTSSETFPTVHVDPFVNMSDEGLFVYNNRELNVAGKLV